ncbi:hypothetical protein [Nocardia sp. NPDC059239]|uniref:hypothetical protein n=1 Tax=unclassified Nocardia TaxID=2637762 RepID=UPI0036CB7D77
MTTGVQRVCALSGPLFAASLFVGMIMAGLFPPKPPSWSAQQVAEFWSTDADLKRAGLVIIMIGSGLLIPFGAILAVRLKKIEGASSPFTYVMLISTGISSVAILLPVFMFAVAAYRPDQRSPELTQAFNDAGWLPFVMNWPAVTGMALAIAFAILGDRSRTPLWPRWAADYNLWTGFLFAAGGFAIFFKHGVFAWNGLLAYWMAAVVFGVWFVVLAYLLWTTTGAHATSDDDTAVAAR